MTRFRFSERSLSNLQGVNQGLVMVAHRAISITKIDFGVIEGVRTPERQAYLVETGASHTTNSKHLTGDAIDVMAYIGNRASWECCLYDEIADAFKLAAQNIDVPVRWGGAWHCKNICLHDDPMECLMNDYVDLRRAQGRRPFLDLGHFEIGS